MQSFWVQETKPLGWHVQVSHPLVDGKVWPGVRLLPAYEQVFAQSIRVHAEVPSDWQVASALPDAVVAGADATWWGGPKVARVVRSVAATKTYEQEVMNKIDPAIVEPVAPGAFQGRVFPLPAQGYIRIVLAYEQTLPRVGDALEYKLRLPKGAIGALDFTLTAPKVSVASAAYEGDVENVAVIDSPDAFTFATTFVDASPGGALTFALAAVGSAPEIEPLAGTDPATQESYFIARVQPSFAGLPATDGGSARGVFLVDTSLSEHPDQFGVNLKILQGILESSPKMAEFGVVTFDASARWLGGGWLKNDAAGRAKALGGLQKVLLEGATDFGAALRALAKPPSAAPNGAVDAFVLSDGVIDWGNADAQGLVSAYEASSPHKTRFFAYRTGLAADNLDLFAALTRRGAIFNCFTAQSIPACSVAHQATGVVLSSITVEPAGEGGAVVENFLVAGRQATLFPGAQMTIAGRLLSPGPAVVRLVGKTGAGAPVDFAVPVTLAPTGLLAPRAWAEIAVGQLVQSHDAEVEGVAMALSQRYRVASRLGSFLVLEQQQTYAQYDLEDETGKFQGQSIAALVALGFEKLGAGWTTWDRIASVLRDAGDSNHVLALDDGKLVPTLTSLVSPNDLELPPASVAAPASLQSDVPAAYVASMTHDPFTLAPFIHEAERRQGLGDAGGAMRALSTLIENDPATPSVERLVGYRLGSWGAGAEAAALFLHVLERRPFEPQSYRDLANALWTSRPALSAMMFEGVLAGTWNPEFDGFKSVVDEEYALLIRDLATKSPGHPLNPYLAQRKQALGLADPTGDLRVTITWNTNDTDIDLWVTDPSGEVCRYDHPEIASGGELTTDQMLGYGPERFLAEQAVSGTYTVQVRYFSNNSVALTPETYVNVVVMTRVGTPEETIERFNVLLADVGAVMTVKRVTFP